MVLTSNKAGPGSVGADCGSRSTAKTWIDDQSSSAVLTCTGTTGTGSGVGLIVRAAPTARTYYCFVIDHASPGSNFHIDRFIAGTPTNLVAGTQTFMDGDRFTLRASGPATATLLEVLRNGYVVQSFTDNSSLQSGSPGIYYSSSETAATIDDWEGGEAPFPSTPLLTTFPGPDEDPISEGGKWVANIRTATATRKGCALGGVGSHRITRSGDAAAASESVWNTSFSADQEVYTTIQRLGSSGQEIDLYLRITNNATSNVRGLLMAYELGAGTANWQWYWLNNTTYTAIGASVSTQLISAGDSIGAAAYGSTLESWYKAAAGSWTLLGSRSDTNITGSGNLGIYITAGSNFEGGNFGGGALAADSDDFPAGVVGRGAGW